MKNKCFTVFAVYGDRDSLEKMYKVMNRYYENQKSNNLNWISDMLRDVDSTAPYTNHSCVLTDCRMTITCFYFETETESRPILKEFFHFVRKIDDNAKIIYYSENRASAYRQSNDMDRIYYDNYIVEYFKTNETYDEDLWQRCEDFFLKASYSDEELSSALNYVLECYDSLTLEDMIQITKRDYNFGNPSGVIIKVYPVEFTDKIE